MSLVKSPLPLARSAHSCEYCSDKAFKLIKKEEAFQLAYTYDAAAKGFRKGCAFFRWCFPEWYLKIPSRTKLSKKFLRILLILNKYDVAHIRKDGTLWKQVRYFTYHDDPATAYIRSRPIDANPGSMELFNKVNQWIEACDKWHSICKAPSFPPPTRVIDLGLDEACALRLRQLERTGSGRSGYICLSYCWGGEQSVRLTNANFAEWSTGKGIPVDSLPQTLQDAIMVTRKTQYQFLWIDSLCIIQDDPDDVEKEISLMPGVYQGASYTILASRASSCNEGFLQERDFGPYSESLVSFDVQLTNKSISTDATEVQNRAGSVILSMEFPLGMLSGHPPEPIELRAWILQEQIMSHRILSYGTKVTHWTCRQGNKSDSTDLRPPFASSLPHISSIGIPGTSSKTEDPGSTWLAIVEKYTKRSSSLRKDRVYAISAVAQEFNRLLDCRYLAGMWESMFPRTLLWRMASDAQLQPRSWDYPAPTWSWMSIHGSVIFPHPIFSPYTSLEPVVEIVKSKMNLTFESAIYGGTRDSYLTILGRLLQAYWTNNRSQLERCSIAWWRDDDERVISRDAVPDFLQQGLENQAKSEVWLLPIMATNTPKHRYTEIHGLILTQTSSKTFQRVGSFSYDGSNVPPEVFRTTKREIIIY